MAPRDPDRVQLDFPQLVADLIRQLRLTGTVGLLELTDQVTPVYIVAQREGALNITTSTPLFTSANMFDGTLTNPIANTVIFDTGQLPAGDYDLFAQISVSGRGPILASSAVLEHRNAANAVTLAILSHIPFGIVEQFSQNTLAPMRYTLALNERIRMRVQDAVTGEASGALGIVIVPTP